MVALMVFLNVFAAGEALACSVCGVYQADASSAPFLQGTALLSLTPLAFMGGTAWYLYRRVKRARQAEEQAVSALPVAALAPGEA